MSQYINVLVEKEELTCLILILLFLTIENLFPVILTVPEMLPHMSLDCPYVGMGSSLGTATLSIVY